VESPTSHAPLSSSTTTSMLIRSTQS
jgi:hypothetical protein